MKSKKISNEHKCTLASFLYLLNSACFMGTYLGLSLYLSFLSANEKTSDGPLGQIADVVYVVNCIIDPLIYGLWLKEVRLEILKIVAVVCPSVTPYTEKMRADVFGILYAVKKPDSLE